MRLAALSYVYFHIDVVTDKIEINCLSLILTFLYPRVATIKLTHGGMLHWIRIITKKRIIKTAHPPWTKVNA
jgi:hypothetical protein